MKYRVRYVWTNDGYPRHSYELVGEKGGIHLHVTDFKDSKDLNKRYSAGLEIHSRTGIGAPSQDKCWLIKAPCWHDGTTLYAEERLLPSVIAANFEPAKVLDMIKREADMRWCEDEA